MPFGIDAIFDHNSAITLENFLEDSFSAKPLDFSTYMGDVELGKAKQITTNSKLFLDKDLLVVSLGRKPDKVKGNSWARQNMKSSLARSNKKTVMGRALNDSLARTGMRMSVAVPMPILGSAGD